ncbi:hypothetical protein L1987_55507 [Smallanthus sonchifolius]|uniref:Uncharacterized protein n=1 Tax=Smallanthus sonchifolius TaxID=185202 RepID=A0ACB9EA89_9ASTR|nr:hypothetical protein L1987_55507 [Smallanthus sonchifolius]
MTFMEFEISIMPVLSGLKQLEMDPKLFLGCSVRLKSEDLILICSYIYTKMLILTSYSYKRGNDDDFQCVRKSIKVFAPVYWRGNC